MPPETSQNFEALSAQAQRLMSVFTRAGYELVAPAIIQPAGIFLDVVGEELRARTYVFSDPEGRELCLRPDLTIPACRHYLSCSAETAAPALGVSFDAYLGHALVAMGEESKGRERSAYDPHFRKSSIVDCSSTGKNPAPSPSRR